MEFNVWRVAGIVVAGYACYALLLYLAQRTLLYPGQSIKVGQHSPEPSPDRVPLWFETSTGKLEAWFLPAKDMPGRKKQPVVLFFHGNGEVIDLLVEQTEGFRALGCGVLLVEYPGYGRSTGSPSEESLLAAAVAAFDAMAVQSDVDAGRIIGFGRSLGCGVACALARKRPLAALILQSPFTSVRDFAPRFFLPPFLVRDVFDNRRAVVDFAGPILILHGRHDDLIPFSHGSELARLSRHGRLVGLACAHNDCPPDWQEFWRIIGEFLRAGKLL